MSTTTPVTTIHVSLAEEKMWRKFYPLNEMIVTKKRGRVIFPHLDYNIRGLDKDSLYTIHLHLERVDNIKYKFDQGEWQEAAKGDPVLPIKYFEHSDGARSGKHWMNAVVSFASVKITNDPNNSHPKLILVQSMHKYRPVLTITRIGESKGEEFRLKLTEFVIVTAYQNEEIIKKKVAHNKFASGFRSNGKRRNSGESENEDPKRHTPSSSSSSSSSSTPNPWDKSLNFVHPTSSGATAPFFPHPTGIPMMNPFPGFTSTLNSNHQNVQNLQWNPYYGNPAWYYPTHQNFVSMNGNMWGMSVPPTHDQTDAAMDTFANM